MTAPTRSEKRRATQVVAVRVTPEEHEEMRATAARLGQSVGGMLQLGYTLLILQEAAQNGATARASEGCDSGSSLQPAAGSPAALPAAAADVVQMQERT